MSEELKTDERMIWCPECRRPSKFCYSTFMSNNGQAMNGWICEEELLNQHEDRKS